MTLPGSGAISFGMVNTELAVAVGTQQALGGSAVRGLYAVPSGAIRLAADGYGKSATKPPIVVTNLGVSTGYALATVAVAPAGSLICVAVLEDYNGALTPGGGTLTDANGNTYVKAVAKDSGSYGTLSLFYAKSIAANLGAGAGITYHPLNVTNGSYMSAFCATNLNATAPLDAAVTATTSGSTNFTFTSGVPGVAGELFVAVCGGSSSSFSFTQDAANGWSAPPNVANASSYYVVGGRQVNAGVGTKSFHLQVGPIPMGAAGIIVGFKQ